MWTHIQRIATWGRYALGVFCVALLCVDVATNNWEIIDYIGDARHLLTPMLTINRSDDIHLQFVFPEGASPSHVSTVGQFMVNTTLAQIQASDSRTFILSMGNHRIENELNDICSQLVQVYPVNGPLVPSVRLGTIVDSVTFVRGNAFSHGFADMSARTASSPDMNATQLRALGYVPARHGTDLRLTTPLTLPPPHQVATTTISMYRYFMKAHCSGCVPTTELGLDTCTIVYSFNETTKSVDVKSSQATMGGYHELGLIIPRRGGPVFALYVRLVVLVLLFGVYGASHKTVQWTDAVVLSLPRRLVRLISPPLYRQPCSVFDLSDICFNSDVFVVLYTATVLLDEEIGMVLSGEIHRWHHNSDSVLVELRLLSMSLRWLWLNCFVLKVAKWTLHFVSMTRFTGDNVAMAWLNFSSPAWIYCGVFVLFQRNDIIELNNSDQVELLSSTQNLDATFVRLFDSWYVRAIPALVAAVVVNLAIWLLVDHVVNRNWWLSFARNSLGRQLMFNSTSILAGIQGDLTVVQRPSDGASVFHITIKARALCTFRWFLETHLTHFGLLEHPSVVRDLTNKTIRKDSSGVAIKTNILRMATKKSLNLIPMPSTGWLADDGADIADAVAVASTPQNDLHILVQDREGHVHLINDQKQELSALSVEVKILRDTTFRVT